MYLFKSKWKHLLASAFVLSILFFAEKPINAQVDARMLRTPDVSKTHIAFTYAGDIWIVPKEGGVAVKLSSPKGTESFAKFSPDGSMIAFSGNYDGNTDIYVINSMGGVPKRFTIR
jgi:tricorn protease